MASNDERSSVCEGCGRLPNDDHLGCGCGTCCPRPRTPASNDEGVRGVAVYTSGGAIGYGNPPGRGATGDDHMRHVMFSLAPEAQAARQSEAAQALDDAKAQGLGNEAQIRAVLRVLGLT